ncbi:UDP-2,3-diacylglucosamine diphosphatase LpxI [Stappia sp. GBMRC 2046]|uniref:UDP-2,3-diacylglucosamine diphosphatase LpxI n=1 Tax=Stappia sediminis TaxID=2692190 RepID=A0A7X3LXT3_9HYPH|nr:UDP-2,3-diacylglucosamine diphosphatase LpxI [Stappia sediminis]MXN67011.1 UDP-2,3-diacylglucosamine diphosphatase LpxI [Stappia sediminis]
MGKGAASTDSPVAIICGGGTIPPAVVEAACRTGREVKVVGIKGEADPALEQYQPVELGWGQIGKLFDTLKRARCRDVVLIGSVTKRPDFRAVAGDLGTIRRLPRILSALKGGDDSLLVKVIGLFEEEGFSVVGAHEVAPQLLAASGLICGPEPLAENNADLSLAYEAVSAIGHLDVGQAAIAVGGRIVAIEGAEGTDAMISRCAELRRIRRIRDKPPSGVLVKRPKPGQDLRVDLPAIGPQTVEAAAEAGLAGIAIEAGRVLIAEKERTLSLAESKRIFIFGFDAVGADKATAHGG